MLAIPLAKKCDRKTLLGISALGVSACLFTLGAFYYLKTYADIGGFGWVALLDFLIYIGFFMVNIIPLIHRTQKFRVNVSIPQKWFFLL